MNTHNLTAQLLPEKQLTGTIERDTGYADGYEAGKVAGREEGYEAGKAAGHEEGQQAEYDRFWDAYQQSGNRTNFQYAYGGVGWTDETYKPKHIDRPIIGEGMFYKSSITTLAVDTSRCTSLAYFLRDNTTIKTIPLIDAQKAGDLYWTFGSCTSLESLRIILAEDNSYGNAFYNCLALKNMTVEGTIAKAINFQWSNQLTDTSVQSIIDHLKDLTGATAQTLKFHADVKARLTADQIAAITAKNWTLA